MTPTLQRQPDRLQNALATPPFHTWPAPQGAVWTAFHRTPTGYLLRFPDLADFLLREDGLHADVFPTPGTTEGTLRHLFLNQVLPLALSRQRQLVLHAGAVHIAGHGAIAFIGASGQGKSTLTAYLAMHGAPLLTDDGLQLQWAGPQCLALPSDPSVRLWADSETALIPAQASRSADVSYTDKARILAGHHIAFCAQAQPLRRVYVLGPGQAPAPCIEPIPPAQALMALVRNAFLLDVDRPDALAWQFEAVGRLSELPLFFHLDYPRRYDALADVHRALTQHLPPHEAQPPSHEP